MAASTSALRTLGQAIRARREAAGLTQAQLGKRAGIVGKYVSEIERGNRDVPFSTLRAIVEDGLGLTLDVRFESHGNGNGKKNGNGKHPTLPPELRQVAELPADRRRAALAVIRALLAIC
ncbi:MAG TPA: helix-turn-helix transcriptional regulator [Kofleriaceae bacterium]|jgi:transcriptional regulator with XRE-family HTH domain